MTDFCGRSTGRWAIVPIRGGSKGLPGKNTRPFAGRPLYTHAVDQAMRVVGRCIISTDIPEVLAASHPEGCVALERPAALAGDDVPMDAVLDHVLVTLGGEVEQAVLLQATSPLRKDADIRAATALHDTGTYDLVLSVMAVDAGVLKCGMLEAGRFVPVSEPAFCFANRQTLPPIYRPNGAVYVFSGASFRRTGGLATNSMGGVVMPASRSIDIDTLADWQHAEAVFAEVGSQFTAASSSLPDA